MDADRPRGIGTASDRPTDPMTTPAPVLVPGWLVRSGAVGWRILALLGMVVVAGLVLAAVPVSATATLISLVLAAALWVRRGTVTGIPRAAVIAGASRRAD